MRAQGAWADGCFVWKTRDADILEPEQRAIIVFDEGREDLLLQVKYDGAPEEFGWIVPAPSQPKLLPVPADRFEMLSRFTQTADQMHSDRVRRAKDPHRGTLGTEPVQMVNRDTVGIYDAVTLKASDGSALSHWLDAHGFAPPPGAEEVFGEYATNGWYFVAMRIVAVDQDSTVARKLATGTSQGVRLQFDTARPVYPLKISSLGSGPSDLIIYTVAKGPLVSTGPHNIRWSAAHCGPRIGGMSLYEETRFPRLEARTAYVSKLRATFQPREMEDLFFTSYDPIPGLRDDDPLVRAAAASWIGRARLDDAAPDLVAMLDRSKGSEPDVLSALWALGELGGKPATDCLLRWARSDSTLYRIEAIESLGRLKEPKVLPIALEVLKRWPTSTESDPGNGEELETALDLLTVMGDRSCLGYLRKISASRETGYAWTLGPSVTASNRLTAVRAACGDAKAMETIRDAIVHSGSEMTTPGELMERASRGGALNGFPSGFWTGIAILFRDHYREWPALRSAIEMLSARPEVLDALLREVAGDTRLPDAGKIVALSALSSAEPGDLDFLDAIWLRSVGEHGFHAYLPVPQVGGQPGVTVRYNLNACCVAYAFSKLHAVDRLIRLWEICPSDDPVLRAEIAHAAARSDSVRLTPIVSEYVREDWNRIATTAEFKQRLDIELDRRHSRKGVVETPRRYSVWETNAFDLDYRTHWIKRFMNSVARDHQERRALMLDNTIHPLVRLYWISDIPCCFPGEKELRRVALEALDQLESEGIEEPFIVETIANTRGFRERMEESRADMVRQGMFFE
jgi:hypothetical protein